MPQGILAFKYEEEKRSGGMTGLARLPTYLELSYILGLSDAIDEHARPLVICLARGHPSYETLLNPQSSGFSISRTKNNTSVKTGQWIWVPVDAGRSLL